MEAIDLFDWQSVGPDMVSVSDFEEKLPAAEGYLRRKVPNRVPHLGPWTIFRGFARTCSLGFIGAS